MENLRKLLSHIGLSFLLLTSACQALQSPKVVDLSNKYDLNPNALKHIDEALQTLAGRSVSMVVDGELVPVDFQLREMPEIYLFDPDYPELEKYIEPEVLAELLRRWPGFYLAGGTHPKSNKSFVSTYPPETSSAIVLIEAANGKMLNKKIPATSPLGYAIDGVANMFGRLIHPQNFLFEEGCWWRADDLVVNEKIIIDPGVKVAFEKTPNNYEVLRDVCYALIGLEQIVVPQQNQP
jgi:hypothetical protein